MQDQPGQKEIVSWIDVVRVLAILLVVMVHVSGQLTNVWGEIPTGQWILADIWGGIARVCVPLFFMISGYLLLPRSESLGTFYRKRMPKILIPLVAWSSIYLGWYCGNHPNTCTPGLVWNLALVQGTYYHLWFLYTIFSIYLVLPLLRLLVRPDGDQSLLWYLIALWFLFQGAVGFAHKFWNFSINISAPLAAGYVPYFVFGYLLGRVALSRTRLLLSLLVWFISTLVTILGTYFTTRAGGQFDGYFYDFLTLNVMLASGGAFLLIRWLSEREPFMTAGFRSGARTLATSAFGIYLIHVLVIEVLGGWIPLIHINSFMGSAIWSVPLVSILVFLISFVFVRMLQRVPLVKEIVP